MAAAAMPATGTPAGCVLDSVSLLAVPAAALEDWAFRPAGGAGALLVVLLARGAAAVLALWFGDDDVAAAGRGGETSEAAGTGLELAIIAGALATALALGVGTGAGAAVTVGAAVGLGSGVTTGCSAALEPSSSDRKAPLPSAAEDAVLVPDISAVMVLFFRAVLVSDSTLISVFQNDSNGPQQFPGHFARSRIIWAGMPAIAPGRHFLPAWPARIAAC